LTCTLHDLKISLSFLVSNCLQGDKVFFKDLTKRNVHSFVPEERPMKIRDIDTKSVLRSSLFGLYFVNIHLQILNANEVYSKGDVIFEQL
jgi:hypothetical protein